MQNCPISMQLHYRLSSHAITLHLLVLLICINLMFYYRGISPVVVASFGDVMGCNPKAAWYKQW